MVFAFELVGLMAIVWAAAFGCYTCVRLAIWNGDPPRWLARRPQAPDAHDEPTPREPAGPPLVRDLFLPGEGCPR